MCSSLEEQQHYRKKYRKQLLVAVAQLRIRMAFEDEIFEHYLINLL